MYPQPVKTFRALVDCGMLQVILATQHTLEKIGKCTIEQANAGKYLMVKLGVRDCRGAHMATEFIQSDRSALSAAQGLASAVSCSRGEVDSSAESALVLTGMLRMHGCQTKYSPRRLETVGCTEIGM